MATKKVGAAKTHRSTHHLHPEGHAKLVFGKTSLSLLTLQYLEAEANERGLDHEDLG